MKSQMVLKLLFLMTQIKRSRKRKLHLQYMYIKKTMILSLMKRREFVSAVYFELKVIELLSA